VSGQRGGLRNGRSPVRITRAYAGRCGSYRCSAADSSDLVCSRTVSQLESGIQLLLTCTCASDGQGLVSCIGESTSTDGCDTVSGFLAYHIPTGATGRTDRCCAVFYPVHERIRNACTTGGTEISDDGAIAVLAFSGDNNWPFAAALAFILMGTTLMGTKPWPFPSRGV
jgi:hypothetical protein